jgi:prepilin-type N-terminal cleavage/methylation domain-containing protein
MGGILKLKKKRFSGWSRQSGVTLLEVMASVAIFSVALFLALDFNRQNLVERQKADSYTRVLTYEGLLRRQIYASAFSFLSDLKSSVAWERSQGRASNFWCFERTGATLNRTHGFYENSVPSEWFEFFKNWGSTVPQHGGPKFVAPPGRNPLSVLRFANLVNDYGARATTVKSRFIHLEIMTPAIAAITQVVNANMAYGLSPAAAELRNPQPVNGDGFAAVMLVDLGTDLTDQGVFTNGTPTVLATLDASFYNYGTDTSITNCDTFINAPKRGIRVTYALAWDQGGDRAAQSFDAKVGYVDIGDHL